MLRSNRRYGLALGILVAALIAFGVARTLIIHAAASEAAFEHLANEKAGAYADRADEAIERRCRSIPASNQYQCVHQEREAARQGARSERELETQVVNTIWTKYTDIAVILGTSAGVIGLILVLATFWQNKRSADAAHDANRPWVDIVFAAKPLLQISEERVYVEAHLKIVNRGNSPATHVAAITQLVGVPIIGSLQDDAPIKALEKIFDNWSVHDRLFGFTVFPNVETETQRYGANLMAEDWLERCGGEAKPMALFLGVGVRYRFGDRTARTLYGYTLVDTASINLAFELKPANITGDRLRVDNGFRGYAT